LTTTKVEEVPPTDPTCLTKGSKVIARIAWERENVVRNEMVNKSSDKASVTEAMLMTAPEMAHRFNQGGYEGGRWAGQALIEGPKPPDYPDFSVELKNRFVLGEFYDEVTNVLVPVRDAIHALRI